MEIPTANPPTYLLTFPRRSSDDDPPPEPETPPGNGTCGKKDKGHTISNDAMIMLYWIKDIYVYLPLQSERKKEHSNDAYVWTLKEKGRNLFEHVLNAYAVMQLYL